MLDFAECERLVSQARDKRSKPLANNTRVEKRDEDTYALRFHTTDIATFHRDGRIVLNTGGWHTNTTRERLGYVTRHLSSERGYWYVDAEPSEDDPRPPRGQRTVLKPFHALDPGPEPIKPEEGCIAGEVHAMPYEEEKLVTKRDLEERGLTEADIVRPNEYSDYFAGYITVSGTDYTYFGEGSHTDYAAAIQAQYTLAKDDRVHYKRCPHCELFDRQYRAWSEALNGGGWGRNRTHGYKAYIEALEQYGTQEAWQEAYITDFRQVREQRKAFKAWVERNRVPFEDGMLVTREGYAPRPDTKAIKAAKKRENAIERKKSRINNFVADAVNVLVTNGLPMPSGGDCWYCCFAHAPQETEPHPGAISMGDAMPTLYKDGSVQAQPSHGHLADHMRERYYVPSMFVNALREANYRDAGIYMFLAMNPDEDRMGGDRVHEDTVTRALRRYLYKRLIPELGENSIPPMVGSTGR